MKEVNTIATDHHMFRAHLHLRCESAQVSALLAGLVLLIAGCGGGGSGGGLIVPQLNIPVQLLNASLISGGMRLALRNNTINGSRQYNIYLATSSGVTQLTNFFNAKDPAWSPDGTRLAFRGSQSGENENIWVINADGSGLRQLTSHPNHEGYPTWSPNGRFIAFSRDNVASTDNEIWLMNADGSDQHRVSPMGVFGGISWSPDGTRLTWSCPEPVEGGIIIMDIDNQGNSSGERHLTTFVGDLGPRWSPDGTQIVLFYSSQVDIRINDRPDEIIVINADGSNRRQITNGPPGNHLCYWGGDNKIYFASKRIGGVVYQTFRMNPDGSGLEQLTTSTSGDVDQPVTWPWP